MRPPLLVASALALTLFLPGCDKLTALTGNSKADIEAEGKAIGSACRHAGRAIEDCFTLNAKANKAAIFEGWREMNDYMTKNKIEVVAPVVPRDPPKPPPVPAPATAAAPPEPEHAAPPPDDSKSRTKRSRSGQQADLPRDTPVRVANAPDLAADPRAVLQERRGGTPEHGAASGHAAAGEGHAGSTEHAPPPRVTAVGASEIQRMKAYANTP
ncbi:hypothetical protein [Derxia gummosa]|uniref:Uncharacterized protein n=1 Tax=Derxia gummosa DSM 723 TaxID=1121388 RepID=A0ABD8G4H3_9BURK